LKPLQINTSSLLVTKVILCSGAKVTLAARVDSFHESTDGHIGIEYKEDIEKKIDKVTYLN
jgi:U4/U6 small nuclear ribonucleoprotein PRP31